jgi:metal-responsive CopG/Arc/MetJ family transcriptional regulator
MVKNEKMMGVWLPEHLLDKIDLMAVTLRTNRSKYIRELLVQLMEQQSIDDMFFDIVRNCISEYETMSKKPTKRQYISQVESAINGRVSDVYKKIIIEKLKEWNENEA